MSKLPNEIRSIGPTFFLAPPSVWERVFSTISAEIKKRPAAIRKLFYLGLGVGSEASRLREAGKPVPAFMRASLGFFDRVVFRKIRQRLGGRIRIAASGAAPLGKELAEFYAAIGMPLIEGYGLTEGGVVALNPLDRPKSGSIGKLLPGFEARVEEDGELMLRGPCLFSGYYKDPEATAAVLRDGWLATGDIAEVDAEGYWYITGRKKDLIVSSNGKKIYPARIEVLFKREPAINQVLLIGDRMPYVTALFTVNGSPRRDAGGGGTSSEEREQTARLLRADSEIQDSGARFFDRTRRSDADHEDPPQPRARELSRGGERDVHGEGYRVKPLYNRGSVPSNHPDSGRWYWPGSCRCRAASRRCNRRSHRLG